MTLTIILLLVLLTISRLLSEVESLCITSKHLSNSHLIFDNDTTTCDRLDIADRVVSLKLEVESSCVHTSEVEFLALLVGHVSCSSLSVLYVNQSETPCQRRSRCQGTQISSTTDASQKNTTCLFKCPKRQMASVDRKYEVHMLYTNHDTEVNLCDLKIRNDCSSSGDWMPSEDWPWGDKPAIYMDFEDTSCITFHNGAGVMDNGKIGRGVHTDGNDGWISLGDLSHITCIISPETCPSDDFLGATILLWMKIHECPQGGGILSSFESKQSNAVAIYCKDFTLGYVLLFKAAQVFHQTTITHDTWIHAAMVWKGTSNNDGTLMYHNGDFIGTPFTGPNEEPGVASRGELKIGKMFMEDDLEEAGYVKVDVDELLIWNRQLTKEEIRTVMNMAEHV